LISAPTSSSQATGAKVDARSDIFSFGAMLYEMVTGVRAFAGTSTGDTLAAVLRAQPKPLSAIVPGVPIELEKVIARCLRKDADRRFQHIDDAKIELQEIKEDSESGLGATAGRSGPSRHRRAAALVGLLALLLTAAVWMMLRARAKVEAPMRVTTLTTMPGAEGWPTFSPGGEQVAFSHGEGGGNVDIYVAMVGSSEVHRLTTDSWADYAPSWSPDGQQIAFQHGVPGRGADRIHLVSPLGGTDRKLSDLPTAGPTSWSKDGNFIAAARWRSSTSPTDSAGIYLVPTHGGEPRPLTHPVPPLQDFAPSFSPDGHRLAYASCSLGLVSCNLEVLDLDAALIAQGPARRLTEKSVGPGGCAWTRDGRSVIFSNSLAGNPSQLWRVGVDSTGPPERIEIAGQGTTPATVPSRDWLAFSREGFDADIYMLQLGRGSQRVQASSSLEVQPEFSPDGRRITFCSSSGEETQVWVAALDGSEARQLTRDLGRAQCSPHWSPDGRRIAFDSLAANGQWHIWIMDADGGPARQLTTDSGSQTVPTWSHDGQWIYFAWSQGNHRDIWRTKTDGGPHERLTHGGSGAFGLESVDGKNLLYQAYDDRDAPLLSQPLSGGAAREALKCIQPGRGFFPAPKGIYYVACASGADAEVHVLQPETGEDKRISTLEKVAGPYYGLAVSPDGTQILYSQRVSFGSDLMLIENFR
jgi:Tol biopolymer transport system component